MTEYRASYRWEFGELVIVVTDHALRRIRWDLDGSHDIPQAPDDHPIVALVFDQLGEYLAGTRRHFDLPLDPEGTDFQLAAWDALRAIPFGDTRSYGQQAAALGRPTAARAVGAANGANPIPIVVPCHRVVGANGKLTGFAGGVEIKAWLLNHEARHSGLFG